MQLGILEQHEADAIRHVQPLVTVDGERVGALHPGDEPRGRLPEPEERTERPVGVQPDVMPRADVGDRIDRIGGAGVDGADHRDHDRRLDAVARSRSIASTRRSTRMA